MSRGIFRLDADWFPHGYQIRSLRALTPDSTHVQLSFLSATTPTHVISTNELRWHKLICLLFRSFSTDYWSIPVLITCNIRLNPISIINCIVACRCQHTTGTRRLRHTREFAQDTGLSDQFSPSTYIDHRVPTRHDVRYGRSIVQREETSFSVLQS